MSALSWRVRILALLQLVLVLPPMLSGSICISADGGERSELGFCACAALFVGTAEATICTPGTAGCGPCRDETFNAMRGAHPSSPYAQVPTSAFTESYLAVVAPRIAAAKVIWVGEPPGMRLPILRC
jgi:hypothetical protein